MKMNGWMKLFAFAVVVPALFVAGCGGGDDDDNGGGSQAGVSGTWTGSGSIDGQGGSYPTTLILQQNGAAVSGTWDGIAVSGSISGNALTLTITPFTTSGVTITGTMTATVNGNTMTGRVSMSGGGNNVTGSFTVTRNSALDVVDGGQNLLSAAVDAL